MEKKTREILNELARNKIGIKEAYGRLRKAGLEDIGFAHIDHHRHERKGFPEVILCEWKSPIQVAKIAEKIVQSGSPLLATRADNKTYLAVKKKVSKSIYHKAARVISFVPKGYKAPGKTMGDIAVVCAGTSDIPVAEEAAVTAETMGNKVVRVHDVGVAGLHRLFAHSSELRKASVVIVVAGMEGALPSVVGGFVSRPVIAVPTSVGYGASFGGVTALLGMLNSCASGVTVVNIDNGFGAGYAASMMNRLP